MKKLTLFLIVISLGLLSGQLYAQKGSLASRGGRTGRRKSTGQLRKPTSKEFYSREVTRVLERRAKIARQRILAAQHSAFPNEKINPLYICRVRGINAQTPTLLKLPSYVHSRKQIDLFLTARENRLYAKKIKTLVKKTWPQLEANFVSLRYDSTHMPRTADPLAFLAKSISKQVDTIAIGEIHEFASVLALVERFLPLLRQAHPKQEIFLFTEFYHQGEEYRNDVIQAHPYEKVFKEALRNNIRVIGLEPPESMQNLSNKIKFEYTDGFSLPFDYSLSGMQRRNEIFAKTIQTYRAQHPDALFILYTGLEHVDYRELFSITATLDPTKTFVLGVLPTLKQVKQRYPKTYLTEERYRWDPLHHLLSNYHFDQPFLYWRDLSRIAGANAHIHAEERFIHPDNPKNANPH